MSGWFGRNLIVPVAQSLVGSALLAGAMWTARATSTLAGQCPATSSVRVVRGELALENGDVEAAEKFAADTLIEAPGSACSNALAAAVEARLYARRLREGALVEAEQSRLRCLARATEARPLIGVSPRIEALIDRCSAS